jgi:hypothetical protein
MWISRPRLIDRWTDRLTELIYKMGAKPSLTWWDVFPNTTLFNDPLPFLHVRDISFLWCFSNIILLPCHQLFYLTLLNSISFGGLKLPNCTLCITICGPGVSLSQKWWQTILEIKRKKFDTLTQIVLHALMWGPIFSFAKKIFLSFFLF